MVWGYPYFWKHPYESLTNWIPYFRHRRDCGHLAWHCPHPPPAPKLASVENSKSPKMQHHVTHQNSIDQYTWKDFLESLIYSRNMDKYLYIYALYVILKLVLWTWYTYLIASLHGTILNLLQDKNIAPKHLIAPICLLFSWQVVQVIKIPPASNKLYDSPQLPYSKLT